MNFWADSGCFALCTGLLCLTEPCSIPSSLDRASLGLYHEYEHYRQTNDDEEGEEAGDRSDDDSEG